MNALLLAAAVLAGAPVDPQTRRLVGLARVWGYVKYVHPAMATATLDWDAALVRALPRVESAASEEDYRKAIGGLLSELRDPATRVVERETAGAISGAAAGASAVRFERIDPRTALVAIPNDPAADSNPGLQPEVCARLAEAARFERVVVDLSSSRAPARCAAKARARPASRSS
jgi:hypothetical protein